MNVELTHFEKFSIAPSPNRDYYGIKVSATKVILYQWKISHGPHPLPSVRVIKFAEFAKDKAAKELIEHVFGSSVLRYLELVASSGPSTLLTLPKVVIEKLAQYLHLEDITGLLRASSVSSEVFDTEAVWKTVYATLKGSSELSDMEREVVANRGFKKLVKDHHARSAAKKSIRSMDDRLKRSRRDAACKSDKVVRSASVNIPKTTLQDDAAARSVAGKRTNNGAPKKSPKPLKSLVVKSSAVGSAVKEEKLNLPKKSASEDRSCVLVNSAKFSEKNIAVEAYRNFKSVKESVARAERAQGGSITEGMSKFKFVNEDSEKTELMLPKKYLKSTVVADHDNLCDDNEIAEELLKSKSMTIASPKSPRFFKRSSHALGDTRAALQAKCTLKGRSKRSTEPTSKLRKSLNNETSQRAAAAARNEEKSEDSDESGMSFLMKRYLEASNEVAKKFSECQRLASATTKNSSVQVDMSEKAAAAERKPMKKMQKYAPFIERSAARKKLG